MKTVKSNELHTLASNFLPGGVNSPVRAFKAVGGRPLFIERAKGDKLYDVDGNELIDYVCSWGAMIVGHAHKDVTKALRDALENGTSYGTCTLLEVKLAKEIIEAFPSIERIRMVNSGTEATMSAIRLARGFTGRDKIIKYEGCYHGHADYLLVKAGSGGITLGIPDSSGVPDDFAKNTLVVPYNDLEATLKKVKEYKGQVAAIIVEPVAANMGIILPKEEFFKGLREICTKEEIVLIFDEVITGFRVSWGGAQKYFDVYPDLTCLGKIIGGGLPVGAFGGKKEIMEHLAPIGDVYQAGTLSGNPIAMKAGIETLKILKQPGVYKALENSAVFISKEFKKLAQKYNLPVYSTQIASLFCTFFTREQVFDYASAKKCDTKRYARFFHGMLDQGIYFAPSQFEAAFLSLAHNEHDIEKTISCADRVLQRL
ncbi:MAG: glutamate-1-semialdehyde 2,1-aminomutase [Thermodesulfobacteriota bacterium]|nr:glutamate-1-semialdehyde 2,1-aminomutase [Thermodesulfobacteriota bacterium]